MAPQHKTQTAPGHPEENETCTYNLNGGWIFFNFAGPQLTPWTAGNANHARGIIAGGWRGTLRREYFRDHDFCPVRFDAAQTNDWLVQEYWSDEMRATTDHTADTHDILTAILAEIRTFWETHWTPTPRVAFECYGQPEAGTTTQTSLHVGKDGLTRPPESYPPSYFPEWLDLRFFGFDWIE